MATQWRRKMVKPGGANLQNKKYSVVKIKILWKMRWGFIAPPFLLPVYAHTATKLYTVVIFRVKKFPGFYKLFVDHKTFPALIIKLKAIIFYKFKAKSAN